MDQHVDQRHAAALGSTVQGGVAKLGLYRLCVYESKYRPSGDYITCTRRTLKNESLDKLAMDFMDVKQLSHVEQKGKSLLDFFSMNTTHIPRQSGCAVTTASTSSTVRLGL